MLSLVCSVRCYELYAQRSHPVETPAIPDKQVLYINGVKYLLTARAWCERFHMCVQCMRKIQPQGHGG